MDKNKILNSDVLDIIFDQRNKSYGAYELRMNYNRRAKKALLFTILIAFGAVSTPMIARLKHKGEVQPIAQQFFDTIIIQNLKPTLEFKEKEIKIKNRNVSTIDKRVPTDIVETKKFTSKDPIDDLLEDAIEGITNHVGDLPSEGIPFDPTQPASDEGTSILTTVISDPIVEPITSDESILETLQIDQWPEFEGGFDALSAYLQTNLKYPKQAVANGTEGKVMLNFVIDKEGNVSSIEILHSVGDGCDEEAKRVVRQMPKWKAGIFKGRNVKVNYQLPIEFKLDN